MGWPLTSAHTLYSTRGSWLSSIAQGCGLSVLMRGYQLTGNNCFLETAYHVARTFERDILDGGVCSPIGVHGIFFEEVAVYPAAHTLHGCVFALLGLYDYAAITENSQILQYIQRGETTLHSVYNEFDLDFWTRADLHRFDLTTPRQLVQQTLLLKALADCTKCSQCAERASRWHQYQCSPISHIRYKIAYHKALLKRALLKLVRTAITSDHRRLIQCPLSVCTCPAFLWHIIQLQAEWGHSWIDRPALW